MDIERPSRLRTIPVGLRRACLRRACLRRALGLGLCALCWTLSMVPPAVAQGEAPAKIELDTWRKVETESFVVYTNADRRDAETWTEQLETFSRVVHVLFPGLSPEPLRPLRVYLFATAGSFNRYVSRSTSLGGFFTRRPTMSLLVVNAGDYVPGPLIYHEYTHFVLRNSLPYLPQWLDEGLAAYFEPFQSDKKKARFGQVHRGWSRYLQSSTWLDMDVLLEITPRSPIYRDAMRTRDFRGQAWALVDFLFEREEGRRAQTLKVLQLLDQGRPSSEALAEGLGMDLGEIQSKLKKNVMFADRKLQVLDLKQLPPSREVTSQELTREEALLRLGELMALRADEETRAESARYFAEVLRQSPEHPEALLGQGFAELVAERPDAAVEVLQRSLASAPSAGAYYYLGQAYLRKFDAEDGKIPGFSQATSPWILKAREAYKKALELDPRMIEAYNSVAHTYIYDAGSPQPGITLAETVLAKVPDLTLALTLVELHSRKGDQASAYTVRDDTVERLISSLSHRETGWVDVALASADLILADAWRLQGREQDARALVKGLADKMKDGELEDEDLGARVEEWLDANAPAGATAEEARDG